MRIGRRALNGPSWLAAIAPSKDRLWSVDLFRAESILLRSYWVLVVMDVYTRRIVGFGVEATNLDGIRVCRNSGSLSVERCLRVRCAIAWLNIRFHRWRANLRVLEVDEIKTLPGTPRSHAFIERRSGPFGVSS